MGRDEQGYAWASQAGAVLSNPFASELARDSETPSLILLRKLALRLHLAQKSLGENAGLRLVSKRRCVVKKHPQARLRGSFPQDIQHSRSESTPCFLFSYPCISS
jgi:hypothetical protein